MPRPASPGQAGQAEAKQSNRNVRSSVCIERQLLSLLTPAHASMATATALMTVSATVTASATATERRGPAVRALTMTHATRRQGLTLVNFSAQLEPCLNQDTTPRTPNTPEHPHNTGCTSPTRNPYPVQSAQVELQSGRV